MRTLAIDLGTKRVGLALSDEGGKYATPRAYFVVRGAQAVVRPEGQDFIDWMIEEAKADRAAAADSAPEAPPAARRRDA